MLRPISSVVRVNQKRQAINTSSKNQHNRKDAVICALTPTDNQWVDIRTLFSQNILSFFSPRVTHLKKGPACLTLGHMNCVLTGVSPGRLKSQYPNFGPWVDTNRRQKGDNELALEMEI